MVVKSILTQAGFVEGQTFKECRFLKPPTSTYAIFLDSYTSRGADNLNLIKDHSSTIELYSSTPDPAAESRIETVLDNMGMEFVKNDRYWLESEGLYQVVYDFDYTEK